MTNGKPVVIVTGGCGYIGSHTIIELINHNFDVISIDNFSHSVPIVYKLIKEITGKKISHFDVNLCDEVEVNNVFKKIGTCHGVIHFAAFKSVPESTARPEHYYKNNLISLLNVMTATFNNGIKNFVFSSSCSVYGDINELPVSETTIPSVPKSSYASTKIMGEIITNDISKAHNLNSLCLRYFNPAGAHPSGKIGEIPLGVPDNLVPVITQTAMGIRDSMTVYGGNFNTRDGSCIRDYVHVMDIANAHVLALEYLTTKNNFFDVINLGTGQGVSVFEAIKAFERVSGKILNYNVGGPREGDVIQIYSDPTKALQILNWSTKYNLDDMMASAWKWEQYLSEVQLLEHPKKN